MIDRRRLLLSGATLALAAPFVRCSRAETVFAAQHGRLRLVEVAGGLDHPWSVAFLPGGDMLVTERPGSLRRISAGGRISPPLKGVPAVVARGQGGLLDVAPHPDFAANGRVYLTYAEAGDGGPENKGQGTAAAYGRLDGDGLSGVKVVFRQRPKQTTYHHYGSRLAFARDGKLFITTGERGAMAQAQNLATTLGKVIRIDADGNVPPDNPFAGHAGVAPEIWSYGHRNLQGAAIHPVTGALWTHEHGPRGGDELNIPQPGRNYGWPEITYGVDYSGAVISADTARPGMEQPVHYWVPSIAPSGMAFYTGSIFPQWRGNLLVGSLKFGLLVRLSLAGDKVVAEERLLSGFGRRIRDVRQGPDGYVYLLTDESPGQLLRVEPLQ